MKFLLSSLMLLILVFASASAQDKPGKGKFSGLFFGDYYYNIDNHIPELKDQRGFWFRRIYMTYDYNIDEQFSSRLRLEMGNQGDYKTSDVMVPFVKDAYLQYKMTNHAIVLGISQTPTLSTVEKVWGYRYIEKTPLDLHRFGSSRDFGLAFMGNLDASKTFKYHAMISNGASNKQEVDKGKSVLASVAWFPNDEFVFEVYGEFADAEGIQDAWTMRAFAAYTLKTMRIGVEYASQTLRVTTDENVDRALVSGFFVNSFTDNLNLILRADRLLKPNPTAEKIVYTPMDPTAKLTLLIAGLEWKPVADVSLTPTVEYIKYDQNDAGVTPGSDLYAKLTYYWVFK